MLYISPLEHWCRSSTCFESQHHIQTWLICKKCKDTETINYELDTNTAKNSSEHVSTQWPSAYRRNMSMCCTKTGNFGWDSLQVCFMNAYNSVFFSPAHYTIELWKISRYILSHISISYSKIISLAHSSSLFCAKYTKTKLHIKSISAFNLNLFTIKVCSKHSLDISLQRGRKANIFEPLSINMMLSNLLCNAEAIFCEYERLQISCSDWKNKRKQ